MDHKLQCNIGTKIIWSSLNLFLWLNLVLGVIPTIAKNALIKVPTEKSQSSHNDCTKLMNSPMQVKNTQCTWQIRWLKSKCTGNAHYWKCKVLEPQRVTFKTLNLTQLWGKLNKHQQLTIFCWRKSFAKYTQLQQYRTLLFEEHLHVIKWRKPTQLTTI